MTYSVTISGVLVLALSFLGQQAGVPFAEGSLEQFVTTGGQIIGLIITYWGRIRQGDVSIFGVKKI